MSGVVDAFTPGPWRVPGCHSAIVADHPVPGVNGSDDVRFYGGHLIAESVAPQNQALIAAAPDLFAVCTMLLKALAYEGEDATGFMAEIELQARAALARVQGAPA